VAFCGGLVINHSAKQSYAQEKHPHLLPAMLAIKIGG